MKKQLTVEEQLMLLAYGAIPSISKFVKNHPDLPEPLRKRAACVFYLAGLAADQKRSGEFMRRKVDQYFNNEDIGDFFDSLASSSSDDPRDLRLVSKLVTNFYGLTDSGMETYANFLPFTSFAHSHWLDLVVRIQKSGFWESELQKTVELFVTKGFSLILRPALNEYGDNALQFFSWFEKLEVRFAENIVNSAIKVWKDHEKDESYNISGDSEEESWYKAALEFSIKISSKEYVSKVFAETFKNDYPEIYDKFKLLVGLDDYDSPVSNGKTSEEQKAAEMEELQKLCGQYRHTPDELVEIIKDTQAGLLAAVMFAISTDVTDNRNEHIRETLSLLVEKYGDCDLVKELTLFFTNNLEANITANSLEYSDLPPSILYLSNTDWHWLF